MGFLSEYTNYRYADFAKKIEEIGIPRTASSTIEDATKTLSRVPKNALETLYMQDAQTFKIVNSYKQLLLQAGYRIVAENKTNQKQYDTFFENMGQIGMHYKLDQLMERIIHDAVLYGHAYVERVYDQTGTKILDLKPVDAKLMDYVRDMKYVIMTDYEQNPLGYTMYVGYYSDAIGDTYPRNARVIPGYIFLRPERIANFILSPFGNGFEGLGLIEPAYKQITRKIAIEEAASNAIFNAADSLKYAIVGDATTKPSQTLMVNTMEALKKWTTNKRAVFSYPTTVGTLANEQSPQVTEMLKYLRTDQAAAAGMSLSMAIGTGESNNKSTMNTERKDFNTKLNAVANTLAEQFNHKILDVLMDVNGYGSQAFCKWNTISIEDRTEFVAELKTLYDMGSITPEEARNYAKNVLDLETDDEAYKLYKEFQSQHLPDMPNQTPGKPYENSQKTPNSNNPVATKKAIGKSKDNYEEKRE